MTIPIITVDGPSGVGKGTLCQAIAQKFGWHLLDSGAIYRILALAAVNHSIPLDDEPALVALAKSLDVCFQHVDNAVVISLEGSNITTSIRQEAIGNLASKIAALPAVRAALLARQRDFKQLPGLVADGRDMGTVVFPEAPVKIFLDASAEERAKRRMKQLQTQGFDAKLDNLLLEIKARDERDRHRSIAPLVPANDALIIDSTELSIDEVIERVLVYAQSKLAL